MYKTKLKCKPCGLFFKDGGITSKTFEGIITECGKCGGELRRIKVHNVKTESLIIHTNTSKIGAK